MKGVIDSGENIALGDVILFESEDGRTGLGVHLGESAVWLTLDQMAELFDRDKSVIVQGYTINRQGLAEKGTAEIRQILELLSNTLAGQNLVSEEGRAVLDTVNLSFHLVSAAERPAYGGALRKPSAGGAGAAYGGE